MHMPFQSAHGHWPLHHRSEIRQSGLRSYIASRILEGNGYETYNFSGGFRFYDTVVNDRALIEMAYACGMDY